MLDIEINSNNDFKYNFKVREFFGEVKISYFGFGIMIFKL